MVYHVRPRRWTALRSALTGRGFDITSRRVEEVSPAGPSRACGCPAGRAHGPGCIASPLMRAEMDRHEEFEGRALPEAEIPENDHAWYCGTCGARYAWEGGSLLHPAPLCGGQPRLASVPEDTRPEYRP